MRTAMVVLVAMVAVGFLLPVDEPSSVPLSGLQLVGEQRTSAPELIAAGKNGNTGKNGHKNGNGGSGANAAITIGGFWGYAYSYYGANRLGGMGGPDLVPVALR